MHRDLTPQFVASLLPRWIDEEVTQYAYVKYGDTSNPQHKSLEHTPELQAIAKLGYLSYLNRYAIFVDQNPENSRALRLKASQQVLKFVTAGAAQMTVLEKEKHFLLTGENKPMLTVYQDLIVPQIATLTYQSTLDKRAPLSTADFVTATDTRLSILFVRIAAGRVEEATPLVQELFTDQCSFAIQSVAALGCFAKPAEPSGDAYEWDIPDLMQSL